jgi:hypothetical protein
VGRRRDNLRTANRHKVTDSSSLNNRNNLTGSRRKVTDSNRRLTGSRHSSTDSSSRTSKDMRPRPSRRPWSKRMPMNAA